MAIQKCFLRGVLLYTHVFSPLLSEMTLKFVNSSQLAIFQNIFALGSCSLYATDSKKKYT
jgi:hypothetical protein